MLRKSFNYYFSYSWIENHVPGSWTELTNLTNHCYYWLSMLPTCYSWCDWTLMIFLTAKQYKWNINDDMSRKRRFMIWNQSNHENLCLYCLFQCAHSDFTDWGVINPPLPSFCSRLFIVVPFASQKVQWWVCKRATWRFSKVYNPFWKLQNIVILYLIVSHAFFAFLAL